MDLNDIIVGRMIRKLRRDKDISQAQLAEALRMQQNVISRVEIGKRPVALGELRALCKFLGVTLGEFVRDYEARAETN